MLPTIVRHPLQTKLASAGRLHYWWLLSFFVGVLCTNMAGQPPALAADATLTPIASITKALTNHQVTVQAVISEVREPRSDRAPYTVSLTEDTATLPLVFWSDLQAQIATRIKTGNVVRVKATVSVYRDQLQLRLRTASAFEVVTAAETTTSAPPTAAAPPAAAPVESPTATLIGKIHADSVGHLVIISGTIATSDSVDKTQRLTIQDATGEIPVVLGEKALAGLSVAELQAGRVVTITGPVKLDNGKPAIVPETAGALKLAPQ